MGVSSRHECLFRCGTVFHVLDVDGTQRPEVLICHPCAGTTSRFGILEAVAAVRTAGPCPCERCTPQDYEEDDEDRGGPDVTENG